MSVILSAMMLAPLGCLLFFAVMAGGMAALPGPPIWRAVGAIEALVLVGFGVRYAVWLYRFTATEKE